MDMYIYTHTCRSVYHDLVLEFQTLSQAHVLREFQCDRPIFSRPSVRDCGKSSGHQANTLAASVVVTPILSKKRSSS